jgi:hypothetical protein
LFKAIDGGLVDAEAVRDAERNGEIGADVEEIVLDPTQRVAQAIREVCMREYYPERRIQLVDSAEGADAAIEFGHARAVAERRLPRVTRPRVDASEPNGLVAATRAHAMLRKIGTDPALMGASDGGIVDRSGWWVTTPTRVGTCARVYMNNIVSAPPVVVP